MSHELGHLTWLGNWGLEVSWENDATFCHFILCSIESKLSDFTGDPVVKNPLANEGDMGLISKIPHVESVSQEYLQTKPMRHNYWALMPQLLKPVRPKVPESSPSRSRSTQGMSGLSEEGNKHTRKVEWKKRLFFFFLFLGQLSFYRMNITSPLSHHILHQILVLCFHQYFSSPCFSPMYSSGTFPIIGFFPRMSHTLVFLPQWPNIFTLTKTMFHRVQI